MITSHKILLESQQQYLHLLSGRKVGVNSSEGELSSAGFDRSEDAKHINDALFKRPESLAVFFINTWSCNLRCPFCYVKSKLNKKFEPENIDIKKVVEFFENHKRTYSHRDVNLTFLGGEPLLYPKVIIDVVANTEDLKYSSLTTNLSVDLTDEAVGAIDRMTNIQVSIDGNERLHNKNRRIALYAGNPTDGKENVFWKTIDNLITVAKHTDPKKINVASALKNAAKEDVIELIKILLECGILYENIHLYSLWNKKDPVKGQNSRFASRPCCSFRYMNHFRIDGGGLYSSYFKDESFLGPLDSDISSIEDRFKSYILAEMKALRDPRCLDCQAFSNCWGGCESCSDGNVMPSEICNQSEMIEKLHRKYDANS